MKPMIKYAYLLGIITASAIFFQFHVALPAGLININLADPFAMLSFFILLVNALFFKRLPQWRIAEFNWILILFGVLLLTAYVIGWMKIGVTQWALSARLVGWVVLLGYLSAGYLIVAYLGDKGIRRLLEVLATTAIVVIVWSITVRLLYGYGFDVSEPTRNFEGFSGNRNAFAFQLLAILALSLAYSKTYNLSAGSVNVRFLSAWQSWVPLGFLFAGIIWSASRAGVLTAVVMLMVAGYKKIVDRRLLLLGVLFAVLLWLLTFILQYFSPDNSTVQSQISSADSNQERWATLFYGFEMWRLSPFFGEGLGVFIANSTERFGHPTVIHNTPLWILAELGLVGALVLGWSFLKLWGYSIKAVSTQDELSRSALLLLLIAFIVFSQFHEMLFQRIIWLVGGALLGSQMVFRHQILAKAG
jgi:O-antigen ligase